jgi:hypothetical protein
MSFVDPEGYRRSTRGAGLPPPIIHQPVKKRKKNKPTKNVVKIVEVEVASSSSSSLQTPSTEHQYQQQQQQHHQQQQQHLVHSISNNGVRNMIMQMHPPAYSLVPIVSQRFAHINNTYPVNPMVPQTPTIPVAPIATTAAATANSSTATIVSPALSGSLDALIPPTVRYREVYIETGLTLDFKKRPRISRDGKRIIEVELKRKTLTSSMRSYALSLCLDYGYRMSTKKHRLRLAQAVIAYVSYDQGFEEPLQGHKAMNKWFKKYEDLKLGKSETLFNEDWRNRRRGKNKKSESEPETQSPCANATSSVDDGP